MQNDHNYRQFDSEFINTEQTNGYAIRWTGPREVPHRRPVVAPTVSTAISSRGPLCTQNTFGGIIEAEGSYKYRKCES